MADEAAAAPFLYHAVKNLCNGGELAPEMAGRFDLPRYQSGWWTLLNMVALPGGGITRRPGVEILEPHNVTEGQAEVRLFPFIYSATQSRMLWAFATDYTCRMYMWRQTADGWGPHEIASLPYRRGELASVSYCQSADVLFFASRARKPFKLSRYSDTDWRLEYLTFMPSVAAPRIEALEVVGEVADNEKSRQSLSYKATAIDPETGEESAPGEIMTIDDVAPLSQTYYIRVRVTHSLSAVRQFRIYKKRGGVFGFIGNLDMDETGDNIFEDRNIGADESDTPPIIEQRPVFLLKQEWPALVFLHQQRLGFASSSLRPMTIWMSQAGNFNSLAASQPPKDDDGIEATLAATQANSILWARSDRDGLALGTEGSEWVLTATEGGAISPNDLSFQPQTSFGSREGLGVLSAGSALLYVQRGGRVVREFGYSFSNDRYESTDVSLLSRHIMRSHGIVRWAWQPEPLGIAWCVLDDGSMAGLTYLREHDVVAWHRHALASGSFCDVATMPDENGDWSVWFIISQPKFDDQIALSLARLRPFDPGSVYRDDKIDSAGRVISLPYPSRAVPCLPETGAGNGTSFMRVKKLNSLKCRVVDSAPFVATVTGQGSPFGTALSVPAQNGSYAGAADWATPLAAGFRENPRLELIFDGDSPATLLALDVTIETAGESGNQPGRP